MRGLLIFVLLSLSIGSVSNAQDRDTLQVGYTEAPPFLFQENGRLDGLNLRIWQQLMEETGRPYKLVRMDFDDVLESLESGDIDATIMPLTITSRRSELYDFTTPYYASHGAIAVDYPTAWERFKHILSQVANSNFLRGILILFAMIFIFGFLGWYFEFRHNTEHFRKGLPGVWDGIYWSAVTLSTVGYGDKAPKTVWGKMAALLLMFSGLVFVSGITAGIASSITVNQLASDYSSLDHFKRLRVGTVEASQTYRYLNSHFFRDVQAYPYLNEGLQALSRGEIKAFMYDEEILKSEINILSLGDDLNVLPIKFNSKFYGFGVAKGRPELVAELSRGILSIRDQDSWQMLLNEYGLSDFD